MKKIISFLVLAALLLIGCGKSKESSDMIVSDYFEKATGFSVQDFVNVGDTTEGLAFNGKDLYVGTYHDGVIYKINADKKVEKFSEGFSALAGIAFDKKGDLWAVEYSGKINQIGPDGKVKKVFTSYKYYFMNKNFSGPNGIAVHSNGTVYVTDKGNIVAIKDGVANYFTSVTTGFTSIANGMALSKDELTLYVLESSTSTFFKAPIHKIKLDANGKYVSKSKVTPTKALTYMDGIAIDANNLLYVTCDLKTVVTIDPTSGLVTELYSDPSMNTPANFAFGYAPGFDRQSIYITQLGDLNNLDKREGYTNLRIMKIGVDGMVIPAIPFNY